ncbi:hypothetical protein SAMN05216431_103128 [Ligilactobacillus sp. WC1T17]|uniref:AB hydrolase-1 domain-containing protein n=1 Tax=Ligilactobacillus ruminis TaxID=1623 RepID=A0ABY1AAB8_9LACO|nr:hypothetical protein SAMN05216431_103128 [Ligilactobacillus ruminis]
MIEILNKHAGKYPVLEIVDAKLAQEELPLVFFYHGWKGCKEKVVSQGYELARQGFRVILPDAKFHGDRQVGGPASTHYLEFWQIIADSVAEFPEIVDYYAKTSGIKDKWIGVSGLSMGGITTCALLRSYDWIKSAVCLMGSPCPVAFAKKLIASMPEVKNVPQQYIDSQLEALQAIDLSFKPETLAGRPVHFWHGTADQIVPYQPTKDFYDSIKEKTYANRITFESTQDGVHRVPYEITVSMADKFKQFYQEDC